MLLAVTRSKSAQNELSKTYATYGAASQVQWDRNWLLAIKRGGRASTASDDWLISANQQVAGTLDHIIGTWHDSRAVDEIVRDIYENRTL